MIVIITADIAICEKALELTMMSVNVPILCVP